MVNIEEFCASSGRTLRAYQSECARAVIDSVVHGRGRVITIMFGRQMGKNETSAWIEAYLLSLYARRGGTIIKAAPSFKPQIINSILRLKQVLDAAPLTRSRWSGSFGYMVNLSRASVAFFSADLHANVVGATASLLLEIDEAQDVDPDKYDREFRPMASSTNATTVLYGTAWAEDSILERQKRVNLEHEARTGERLHFEYDWRVLARISSLYKEFVSGEIARLGQDHPTIRTQYLLQTLSDAGRLFSQEQRSLIRGSHPRERAPHEGAVYVAGIDLAGQDEEAEDAIARSLAPRRDSTVVTIAELSRDAEGSPVVKVVDHVWWTGRDHVWQYERLLELFDCWKFRRVCVDASGIGAGIASFLVKRYPSVVEEFVFTAPSKSKLAYAMLAMANTGRLSIYEDVGPWPLGISGSSSETRSQTGSGARLSAPASHADALFSVEPDLRCPAAPSLDAQGLTCTPATPAIADASDLVGSDPGVRPPRSPTMESGPRTVPEAGVCNTPLQNSQLTTHNSELAEFWREISLCRYWLRANEQLNWGVPPSEGHDDFVASLALCCRAAEESALPAVSGLIRPPAPRDLDAW